MVVEMRPDKCCVSAECDMTTEFVTRTRVRCR